MNKNTGKKRSIVLDKTPVLIQFLHFFKKIELFCVKTVGINIFLGGIQNSVKIGHKRKGQAQKMGVPF